MIKSIDVKNDKNMMVLFDQTGDDGNDQHTTQHYYTFASMKFYFSFKSRGKKCWFCVKIEKPERSFLNNHTPVSYCFL